MTKAEQALRRSLDNAERYLAEKLTSQEEWDELKLARDIVNRIAGDFSEYEVEGDWVLRCNICGNSIDIVMRKPKLLKRAEADFTGIPGESIIPQYDIDEINRIYKEMKDYYADDD